MSYAELEEFYEGLVTRARSQGIVCAITSGMACVAFGVAQSTRDCDLLCAPVAASKLFELLTESRLNRRLPAYRGRISPPLDERWLRGGWTSHFVWDLPGAEAYLDVFGMPPRGSSPWEREIAGFYAARHTVAEMKRTSRERDWPAVTALGAQMIQSGDKRGWLHIYDEQLIGLLVRSADPEPDLLNRRPVLELAITGDPRLRSALHAEIQFWHELDRIRLRVYQEAMRRYVQALRKASPSADDCLAVQHEKRVVCAEKYLSVNPLAAYGVRRMIAEARTALRQLVNPAALAWLPEVQQHFTFQEA